MKTYAAFTLSYKGSTATFIGTELISGQDTHLTVRQTGYGYHKGSAAFWRILRRAGIDNIEGDAQGFDAIITSLRTLGYYLLSSYYGGEGHQFFSFVHIDSHTAYQDTRYTNWNVTQNKYLSNREYYQRLPLSEYLEKLGK